MSAFVQQVTKATTVKRISMTARVTLAKTRPTAMMELTITSVFVLQVLTEQIVSTISTNALPQTAKTTVPVWIKSMGFIASARKDSLV